MKRYVVLITGGIGSGKSAVCDYLRGRGVPVYDSDSRTKALYDEKPEIVAALERQFGTGLRLGNGSLDRRKLASVIFASPEALKMCEDIVHPAVLEDFLSWKDDVARDPDWCGYCGRTPFVCMESAIAMEKPLFRGCYDVSVCVDADESTRIDRACRRDGCDREAVAGRIARQNIDPALAGYVIKNDGGIPALEKETDRVFSLIASDMNAFE